MTPVEVIHIADWLRLLYLEGSSPVNMPLKCLSKQYIMFYFMGADNWIRINHICFMQILLLFACASTGL